MVTNIRLFQAFVIYEGGSAPLDFYSDMGQTTEVVQVGLFVTSLAIADAMMIYRTWVIWNYNRWIAMPPTCIFVGLIVSGIGITYQFSRYTPTESIFIFRAGRWISSECVFTLCINIYCTGYVLLFSVMIVWRIMKINAASKRFGGANLTPALAIFVESAGLYTSWAVIYFACYESRTNFHATAQDIWCIISGISFLLIIVRVGMGWAHGPHASGTREILYNTRDRMPVSLCRTTPLAITVTRVTEQDHESAEERKFMAESPRMLDSMQVA
ncbi:hypothetical protein SERLA73DRAFT_97834 [Serpula lacrymans var. lacrymans S7.3]|uniref:Uncharacterized protein n=1 Tax=Serpula lacrymans var. lacrymans (strain S7.3) TaxID=936435 RepID=F8QEB8_SERL3|nr:hypothetical protein SERLA73DRAFT_97834 [Serpula lacrymans var. lacrymans S7.3]